MAKARCAVDAFIPHPAAGSFPLRWSDVRVPPRAGPSPSPGGEAADAAHLEHARELGRSAEVRTGDALRRLYDLAIRDDVATAMNPSAPWQQRLGSAALLGGLFFGPEEVGLEAIGEGVYVADRAAASVAGRGMAHAGRLVVHESVELDANETRIAAMLVREGRSVEALPRSFRPGERTADFRVDGVKTELKTVSKITSKDVTSAVKDKLVDGLGQARDLIVDLRRQPGFTREMAQETMDRLNGTRYSTRFDSIRLIGKDFDKVYKGL